MENNEIKVSEMVECSDILDDDLLMIIQNRANKKISFKTIEKAILKVSFPIGSTYITQTNTNPSEILGFGTWERFKGKVIVGLDEDDDDNYFNKIGKMGGEKKHTLTINEMPSHNHGGILDFRKGSTTPSDSSSVISGLGGNTKDFATGGGQPFNITQPYEVVGYMWIRRA